MEKVVSHRPLWTWATVAMNTCIDRYEHVYRPLWACATVGVRWLLNGVYEMFWWFSSDKSIVIRWFSATYHAINRKRQPLFSFIFLLFFYHFHSTLFMIVYCATSHFIFSSLNRFTLCESIAKPLYTKGSVCNVTDICYNITKRYNLTIASNKVRRRRLFFGGRGGSIITKI